MLTEKERLRIIATATTRHLQGVALAKWKLLKETDESLWIGLACAPHVQVRQDKVTKIAFLMEESFAEMGFEVLAFAQHCGELIFREMAAPLFGDCISRERATRACKILLAMYAAAATGNTEFATPELAVFPMQMASQVGDDSFESCDELVSAVLNFVTHQSEEGKRS